MSAFSEYHFLDSQILRSCKCQLCTCLSLIVSTALKPAPCLLTQMQFPSFLAPVSAPDHEREQESLGREWLISENATEDSICVVIVVVFVQSLSCVQLFATPWTAAHQAPLSSTTSWRLLRLMSTESMMPSDHLILLPPSLPVLNLSQHQGLFQ